MGRVTQKQHTRGTHFFECDGGFDRRSREGALGSGKAIVAPAKAGATDGYCLMSGASCERYLQPQVPPVRIGFFDQTQLPRTPPFLDLFFAGYRSFHGIVKFVVHQHGDVVFVRESRCQMFAVLPCALHQVAGNADVQGSIPVACEDVGRGLLHDDDGWLEKL